VMSVAQGGPAKLPAELYLGILRAIVSVYCCQTRIGRQALSLVMKQHCQTFSGLQFESEVRNEACSRASLSLMPQVRFLLADRLLLGLGTGGPLPLPALHLLVALLAAADGGSSGGSSSISSGGGGAPRAPAAAAASESGAAAVDASSHSVLAAAALRAAQLWGDVGALRQMPPPRQVCYPNNRSPGAGPAESAQERRVCPVIQQGWHQPSLSHIVN
jgi:hypothetical protein